MNCASGDLGVYFCHHGSQQELPAECTFGISWYRPDRASGELPLLTALSVQHDNSQNERDDKNDEKSLKSDLLQTSSLDCNCSYSIITI
ncbi:unnamed protein product [Bubo scandiacus]